MSPRARLRPVVSIRTRLWVAASVWSGVGSILLVVGLGWMSAAPVRWSGPAVVAAMILGFLKGKFILARGAEANARRIETGGDGRWVGSVFSPRSWALIPLMSLMGYGLRRSSLPRPWIGLVYGVVGTALVYASLVSWKHWREARG